MNGKIRTFFSNPRNFGAAALAVIFVALMMTPSLHAHAVDLFKNGKTTVKDTFGSGSTVIWILYVLEILAAMFSYIKTKNLAVFGGIAAIMVFVNVVFGLVP
ncbi:TPA: type IV conjugative transfer system pilin TraA [Klebsiella oxytoca]|nr:type IV conjugative transfer system pilin TraA [Klebsiella oxytoca]HAT3720878.1 TraA fimbrial protein precursor [Klebsiella oxytoca]HEJ8580197.1 type IV conjugative transfer system pilin TraA [Klebsiella oxytoca]